MESPRLPRFKRLPNLPALVLTLRDRQIIHLVYQHRFLRSNQIAALLNCTSPSLLRRLQLLYHHGYLERPSAQLDYYHQGGSRPIAYGMGNKGGILMRQELGDSFRPLFWGEKNRAVGRVFLEHALLVSEVMVAVELACLNDPSAHLLWGGKLNGGKPFHWKAKLNSQRLLGIVPDRAFVLEFVDTDGKQQRDQHKQYRGWREGHAVRVIVNDQPLNLRLEVCNHSPTGFEWGYHGSGPAQLALALLIEHLEDTEQALTLHQSFKQQVIARLPFEGWTLTTKEIEGALHSLPFPVVTYAVRIRR